MAGDALAAGEGQIQPRIVRVVDLDLLDDDKRMEVGVPAALIGEEGIERRLASVTERRVPEVVAETDRLGQGLREIEQSGDGATDLRRLQCMCQTGTEEVALR